MMKIIKTIEKHAVVINENAFKIAWMSSNEILYHIPPEMLEHIQSFIGPTTYDFGDVQIPLKKPITPKSHLAILRRISGLIYEESILEELV